jgi:signal peptidase I
VLSEFEAKPIIEPETDAVAAESHGEWQAHADEVVASDNAAFAEPVRADRAVSGAETTVGDAAPGESPDATETPDLTSVEAAEVNFQSGEAISPSDEAPPQAAAIPPRHASAAASFMTTIQSLAITVAIAVFVITFIVQAFQIPSESMENTLLIGDYLLVDKVHYGPHGIWGKLEPYEPIKHGDIIVFKYPVNPTQHFVKRVIGVPGDRIRLINKRVFVNGKPQTEPYVTYSRGFMEYADNFPVPGMIDPNMENSWYVELNKLVEGRELIVPEDSYFVLGDNRDKSLDSRYWGFVPRENVVGRPLLIYFSMRRPIEVTTPLSSFSDKLHDLTYNLSDLSGRIRWRRAFRLIK